MDRFFRKFFLLVGSVVIAYGGLRLAALSFVSDPVQQQISQRYAQGEKSKVKRTSRRLALSSDVNLAGCDYLSPNFRKSALHGVNRIVNEAASQFRVDPNMVYAVIFAESRCNADATSEKGAVGLMQVLPATAREMGYPFDGLSGELRVRRNIFAGAKYLSKLSRTFNGNMRLTLAAYNAGPGAVQRFNSVPPFRETQSYVERVIGVYAHLKRTEI